METPSALRTASMRLSLSPKTNKICDCGSPDCDSYTCLDTNQLASRNEMSALESALSESVKTVLEAEPTEEAIAQEVSVEPEKEESLDDDQSPSPASPRSPKAIEAVSILDNDCLCSFADKKNALLQQYIDYFNDQIQFTKHLQKLELSRPTKDQATNLEAPNCIAPRCQPVSCDCAPPSPPPRKARTCAINRNIHGEVVDWLNASSLFSKTKPTPTGNGEKYIIVQCADMMDDGNGSPPPSSAGSSRNSAEDLTGNRDETAANVDPISKTKKIISEGTSAKSLPSQSRGVQVETDGEKQKRPLTIRVCGWKSCNCKGQGCVAFKRQAVSTYTKALNNFAKELSEQMANAKAEKINEMNQKCCTKEPLPEPAACCSCEEDNNNNNRRPKVCELPIEKRFADKPSAFDSFEQLDDNGVKVLNNVTFFDGCPAVETSCCVPAADRNNKCYGPRYCIDIQHPRRSFYPNTAIQVCSYELIPLPVTKTLSATSQEHSVVDMTKVVEKTYQLTASQTPPSSATQSENVDEESVASTLVRSPTSAANDYRNPSMSRERQDSDEESMKNFRRLKSSLSRSSKKQSSAEKSLANKRVSVELERKQEADANPLSESRSLSKAGEVIIAPSIDSVEERVKNLRMNLLTMKEEGRNTQESYSETSLRSLRNRDINIPEVAGNVSDEDDYVPAKARSNRK